MSRVVAAVYERGVLRPLQDLDLEEGERVTLIIRRERGVVTRKLIEELRDMLEELPALRVDSARAEELYAEGKMHSR